MKISYAITVCSEFTEIQKLVSFLLKHKRNQDEIVILYDSKNGSKGVEEYLRSHSINGEFNWHSGEFNNHFADWKNKLSSYCSGNYIFQIDADEIPNKSLIDNLPTILKDNPDNEVYLVPRVNTVVGLTPEHIKEWKWRLNEKEWVNWPDHQWRIWKNKSKIVWVNKVHEKLDGYKTFALIPPIEEYALYHPKTIKKQEKQNKYYSTL
tara:strand:- start:637 stop:1260 length:624 start_codon:yes stop_codon:yes gene_type:complete